ncbi:MAG: response regulator transcription factor [Ornithinimicrobium sp.]
MTDRHVLVIPVGAESRTFDQTLLGLSSLGVAHTVVPHAESALSSAAVSPPVAVIVHGGSSEQALLRVLERLVASAELSVPVMVLASGLHGIDRTRFVTSGAHDVLDLPVTTPRLRLQLLAIRRSGLSEGRPPERFVVGPLTVDAGRWEAWMDGQEIALTRSEFNLLLALVRDPCRTVTRRELARAIDSQATSKAVEAHISRLRKKITAVHGSRVIEPVRGIGYRLGTLEKAQKAG